MIPVEISKRWTLLLPEHRARDDEWWDRWETERLLSMSEHLGPGDVVYYVGAEQGDMPALCASWGCETALIEPTPQVWPNMRAIYDANDLTPPLATFVGFAGATDRLAHENIIFGWSTVAYGPVSELEGFANLCERPDIPVVTLNTLSTAIAPPTAVSIDVEGAELEVLRGAAAEVLTKHRPKLWISLHPDFIRDMYHQTIDDVYAILDAHHYKWETLAEVHEIHIFAEPIKKARKVKT